MMPDRFLRWFVGIIALLIIVWGGTVIVLMFRYR